MDFITVENLKAYWHLWALGSIILLLVGYFIFRFLLPSFRLSKELRTALSKLKSLTGDGQANNVELIGNDIMISPKLKHCWTEFSESLHPQSAPDEFGQERIVRWRSTVPAEAFFNVETLIAVELRTEYFKHQPGILTGIGIIGTFAGLLRGLSQFSVSSNPETVRGSLDALIHGVVEAFAVSASAIALAMITTFLEKIIVTRRIKQVEELCQALDSLFEGGAGEEYLARLVKAGESSATQTAQLKDVLVSDLKEILMDMVQRQTDSIAASFASSSLAQIESTEQSGVKIATAITDILSEPIQKIAAAVNTTTDTNGQVVTKALNEALVTFSAKLEDMFGGQMSNINQLLQQTTSAMQSTVSRFDQLANNLDDAGKNAADAMTDRLSSALESMEARQLALNTTMTEFVSQLRDMVQSSQSETNSELQKTLASIGEQVAVMTEQLQNQAQSAAINHQNQQDNLQQNASTLAQELASQVQSSVSAMQQQLNGMIDAIQEQSKLSSTLNSEQQNAISQHTKTTVEALSAKVEIVMDQVDKKMSGMMEFANKQAELSKQSHQAIQQNMAEQTKLLIEQLSEQLRTMIAQNNSAVSSMQTSISSMRDITKDNTQRMETSASTLALAADNFAKAGNSVSSVMQQTSTIAEKMSGTALTLNNAATTVQTALTDYNQASQAMSQMVQELKTTIEIAKQDASVSQNLVSQIKQSAEHLQQAQSSVDRIFQAVCDELANAQEEFSKNLIAALKSSNTAYQKELKDAVDYLKSAIEELGEVAEKIPARR